MKNAWERGDDFEWRIYLLFDVKQNGHISIDNLGKSSKDTDHMNVMNPKYFIILKYTDF